MILAMDRYFNTYENVEPNFVARVWLGDTYVAENEFKGYTTDTFQTTVPMEYLMQASTWTGRDTGRGDPEGRRRAAVLQAGDDLCADRPEVGAAGDGVCRRADVRRRWTIPRT